MSMETLKEEILKDAEAQAASLMNPARREASRIVAEAKKKAEAIRLARQEETKKATGLIARQEAGKAQLQRKKILLETRKKCVEAAFREAMAELQSMDARKRSSMISSLIGIAEKQIPVAGVACRKEDVSLVRKYPAAAAEMSGGIVAESKDKSLVVDLSLDALFAELRSKELQKVSGILFGEKA